MSETDQALRTLYERHGADLLRFTQRLTHDPEHARDVVQEVLLRAWRHPELAERPDPAVRAWLFTVARRLVIDRWRSAAHRHEVLADVEDWTPAHQDGTAAVLDRWLVADALAGLSPDHRAVVVAAYYEGRPVSDIARRQRIPEGTVKSRLHYALRSLRLILQEKGVTAP